MYDIASKSYQIVRGLLETNHNETTPLLINTLREHAQNVAQRANIVIDVKTSGMQTAISLETKRAVFYAFQELIQNIEKHAHATKAEIQVDWKEDALKITIADDGVGFQPQAVDEGRHFGLGIVQERIIQVNGRVEISSVENEGTTAVIFVPLEFVPAKED
jgi:signal transduction histidine kinase